MENKEKVLAYYPTAEVERHKGYGNFHDKYLITDGNDYISGPHDSEEEAWEDAVFCMALILPQPCHRCAEPVTTLSDNQKTRMGNLYCSITCADLDWPNFNRR